MAHVAICEHIKDSGEPCCSPALTGYVFCYFHQRLREPRHRPGDFEYRLPVLDSPHAILMATQHIAQGVLDSTLEDRRARMLFSALRLAMSTLKEMQKGLRAEDNSVGLSPRASVVCHHERSEGSALCPSDHDSANDRGRAGLQPRVVGCGAIGALAPVVNDNSTPARATDPATKKPPQSAALSATQTKLLKKIIRRGPKDPRFATAARLLDRKIAVAN